MGTLMGGAQLDGGLLKVSHNGLVGWTAPSAAVMCICVYERGSEEPKYYSCVTHVNDSVQNFVLNANHDVSIVQHPTCFLDEKKRCQVAYVIISHRIWNNTGWTDNERTLKTKRNSYDIELGIVVLIYTRGRLVWLGRGVVMHQVQS